MAKVVTALLLPCACGGLVIVQIWSCGCQIVTFNSGHTQSCHNIPMFRKQDIFEGITALCGKEGHPQIH